MVEGVHACYLTGLVRPTGLMVARAHCSRKSRWTDAPFDPGCVLSHV